MKLEIVSRDYKMTDGLKALLSNKLDRLDKYFPNGDTPAKVVLKGDEKRAKMEISIFYHGAQIRSEVGGNTMYHIIDDILPKLERQIVKYRGKLNERYKMPALQKDDYMFVSGVAEDKSPEIAKTKKFPIQRMGLKEALINFGMLDHDFYLFVNEISGNVEVVYRRQDGSVGHLQPYIE